MILAAYSTVACTTLPKSKMTMLEKQKKTSLGKVRVELQLEEMHESPEYLKNESAWGERQGGSVKIPRSLILRIGNSNGIVKYSAFSDLLNIVSLDIDERKGDIIVLVDGGSTSTYYKAEIVFDKEGYLKKRYVYSPTFKDEVFEKTEYSFIRRKNM